MGSGRPPPRSAALAAVALFVLGGVLAGSASAPIRGAAHPVGTSSSYDAATLAGAVAAPRPAATSGNVAPLATITLTVAGVDPTTASLSWTQTGVVFENYTVQVSTNGSGGPFSTVGTLTSQTTTTFDAPGLTPGASYSWRVLEYDLLAGTSTSNVATASQPPLAVLTSANLSATDVQFNWTNNATYGGDLAFVEYDLYESVNGAGSADVATLTAVGDLTATVTGLAPATSYAFYVNTTDCYANCATSTPTLVMVRSNTLTLGTPLPLTASISTARSEVDVGQLDLFTCTPSGGVSPFTFAWDFGNGTFVAGPSSESIAFSLAGNVLVTCRVTDATPSVASAATTVTVALDPTAAVTVDRTTADVGQTFTFGCVPGNGTAPYSVVWTFGDGAQALGGSATHDYSVASRFAASCSVTDSTATTIVVGVGLLVSPTLAASVSSSSATAAPGSVLTFAAAPANGSGVYANYTWDFGDGGVGATTSAGTTHAYARVGTFTVTLTVRDTNDATALATTGVVVSAIAIGLQASDTSATTGDLLDFSVSPSGGAGAPYTVAWVFGDGATASGAAVNHSFDAVGSYAPVVTVTDRLGASTNATLPTVVVGSPPPPPPLVTPFLVLLLALLLGIVVAVAYEVRRRSERERMYPALAGRIPATGATGSLAGRKICRVCGTANLPIRESCEACGASLRGPVVR